MCRVLLSILVCQLFLQIKEWACAKFKEMGQNIEPIERNNSLNKLITINKSKKLTRLHVL